MGIRGMEITVDGENPIKANFVEEELQDLENRQVNINDNLEELIWSSTNNFREIKKVIPSEADEDNQLADKRYVDEAADKGGAITIPTSPPEEIQDGMMWLE